MKDCCRGYSGIGTVGWGSVVRTIPGEVGVDVCGVYPKDEKGQANMRLYGSRCHILQANRGGLDR